MEYITGIQALNLPCSLDTCGDWHTSALQWVNLDMKDSSHSIYKNWGIEKCSRVPEHDGEFYIADTLRALLDLLCEGKYSVAQGAKEDFICNDKYTPVFFEQVMKLADSNNWTEIDNFMCREYELEWLSYKEGIGQVI